MRKPSLRVAALVLALLLAGGTVLTLFVFRPTLKVAARTEIIALWSGRGVDKALGRELGVRIKWMDYGAQEVYQRVLEDLDKPAGKLPDVYLGLGLESRQIGALAAQNALLDIGADPERTPNLLRAMNSDTSRIPEMKLGGRMYSFPALRESLASVYPQKAWINIGWLEKAGLPVPSTPERLHAALLAFKALDGNGNGIADETPLGAAYAGGGQSTLGFLIAPFVTTDYDLSRGNYLNVENGRVYAGVTEPAFKEALAYLRGLYADGLTDKAVFTQSTGALKESAGGGEKYGVILAQDILALLGDERAAGYAPLPPLIYNGHSATLVRRGQVKTGGFLIPARIAPRRQKRALALGDAMLGPEGTRLVCFEGAAAVYSALRGEVPCWEIEPDEITRTWYAPVGEQCIGNALPPLSLPPERTAELSADGVYGKVTDALVSYTRAFVTGEKSLETQWDAYLAALDAAGLQKMISYTQEAYDRRDEEVK
ncbi:MAG: extracellular solute-binding protein [Firmicutes bacterium]|nr:extracellular solute-binding protein [Bacillota bacterium]